MRNGQRWRELGTAMLILSLVTPPPATGQTSRMVMVDGLSMHVVSAGLEARTPEQPVVIFESGQSSPLRTWNPILPAVAEFAPVLTYDRSGVGSTPWDGLPRTPARVVARLHALLDELDVAPPYVLVGHSWGGPLIHHFAGEYPDEVVGMVYIDPTDFMMTLEAHIAMLDSLAPGGAWIEWYERDRRIRAEARASYRPSIQTVVDQLREYPEREHRPAPDVPTFVIKAGRLPPRPDTNRSNRGRPLGYMKARGDLIEAHLRTLVRSGGEYINATSTQHIVQAAEPELVIDVIRRVLLISEN